MTPNIGDRIKLARELRGLSQVELAQRLNVSQPTLSMIERGKQNPSGQLIDQIILTTQLPRTFFRVSDAHTFPLGSLLYRARTQLRASDRDLLRAWAEVAFYAVTVLIGRLRPFAIKLPRLMDTSPEEAASLARSEMGLAPDMPIANLIRSVERVGVQVLSMPLEVEGISAFSAWVGAQPLPVIVLSKQANGDHQRFTVAHELAHLVLHYHVSRPVKELEEEAHRFAAELLLPREAMRLEITTPFTLKQAADIKVRWGVSMLTAIRRAYTLKVIKEHQYQYLMKQAGARGWRTSEPVELHIAPEQPRGFRQMAEIVFGKPINVQAMGKAVNLLDSDVVKLLSGHAGQTELPGVKGSPVVLAFPDDEERSKRNRA